MATQTLIAHDDYAGREPAIVLIHGLSCAASDWEAQVQHFKGRNRVVAVDLRGHGRSMPKDGAFDGNFDMPTAGQDVADLITALGIRSAIVAGHSMGCRAATEAALRLPRSHQGRCTHRWQPIFDRGPRQGSGQDARGYRHKRLRYPRSRHVRNHVCTRNGPRDHRAHHHESRSTTAGDRISFHVRDGGVGRRAIRGAICCADGAYRHRPKYASKRQWRTHCPFGRH